MDQEAEDLAEAALIQAIAAFVRLAADGEVGVGGGPEPLLSIADAARYLNVSTTTVRNLAVGGKVRSSRVSDRIRFRRTWLDEWIDAGGGEVPVPLATRKPPVHEGPVARAGGRPGRRRPEPKSKPATCIQRVGEQELRLLSDQAGGRGQSTWHIGARLPLCEATGRWMFALKRWPRGFICKACLTAIAALPEADLALFDIGQLYMMRLSQRGESATVIRAGYHAGDGRKTLCGKKDGRWALTEREPRTKQCFICDHRRRWDRRNIENSLAARPMTPLRLLVDAGPIDPRLLDLIDRHPGSLEARHAREPLDERAMWGSRDWVRAFQGAEPLGQFAALPILKSQPERWSTYTISDRGDAGATTDFALGLITDWAADIERAATLYARWAKEPLGCEVR